MPKPLAASLLVVSALALFVTAAHGQPRRNQESPDERVIREAQLVASGERIELYQHETKADPALVRVAEETLARMEDLLGARLDEATLGSKIKIYVAGGIRVSHVWRGYEHPRDPKGIILLNPQVARAALLGTNATYAHEMAHLLTWRFYSHTLREGLADYLALKIHPGAGVGPNPSGYPPTQQVPSEVAEYLGTTRTAPESASSDPSFRQAYYYGSYRFVSCLIERSDMNTFMKLYAAHEPQPEFARLYGATREALVAKCLSEQ